MFADMRQRQKALGPRLVSLVKPAEATAEADRGAIQVLRKRRPPRRPRQRSFGVRPRKKLRVESLMWAITLILGVPFALLIPLNWLSFIGWVIAVRRGHRGGHSFAPPFLCGIAGAIACLVCPWPGVWRWAWVPPLLDPSIALLLTSAMLDIVARLAGLRSPFDGPPP